MNRMKVLVVGSGGREHALAWKLAQEAEVFAIQGNPGIAHVATVIPRAEISAPSIVAAVGKYGLDLVVVGPEDPLVLGLGNDLRAQGIAVFGPDKDAAQLEASKAFSKEVMLAAGIPTASFRTFHHAVEAEQYVRERYADGHSVAVKASGNALGKGVVVTDDVSEAVEAVHSMMVRHEFGEAGSTVVIEDRLRGREFSVLTVIGDSNFVSLPISQDHKRVFDGDHGPNTGGMGTYSPCDWVTEAMVAEVEAQVVHPLLLELKRRHISYRGTLFTGVMMHHDRPYCLEFNVRFGDPETQTVMRRLGKGFVDALYQAATGGIVEPVEVLPHAAVTVVMASHGYPGRYQKGVPIQIGTFAENVELFHAGTALTPEGQLVTAGGRVFGVSATGGTVAEARQSAYAAAKQVQFAGGFCRSDIAAHT